MEGVYLKIRQKNGPQGSRLLEYPLQTHQTWSEYMIAMMREGHIPFMLPWHLVGEGQEQALAFDITGEISLFEYFKLEGNGQEILRILKAILTIWEDKDEFFLADNGFIPDIRYWFWNESGEKLRTVYIPIVEEIEIAGAMKFLRSISKTLLLHSLHYHWKNEQVICLIHRLYNVCAEQDCGIKEMKEWIRREETSALKERDEKAETRPPATFPIILEETPRVLEAEASAQRELEQLLFSGEKERGIWSRIKSRCSFLSKGKPFAH